VVPSACFFALDPVPVFWRGSDALLHGLPHPLEAAVALSCRHVDFFARAA